MQFSLSFCLKDMGIHSFVMGDFLVDGIRLIFFYFFVVVVNQCIDTNGIKK